MAQQPTTITLITTSGTLVRGEHVDEGTVLQDMPREEALIYLQAGRARLATEAEILAAAEAEAEAARTAAQSTPAG